MSDREKQKFRWLTIRHASRKCRVSGLGYQVPGLRSQVAAFLCAGGAGFDFAHDSARAALIHSLL